MKKVHHLAKKYFIPGEHNDHKPHILRTEATVFFLAVILVAEMIFLLQVTVLQPRGGYFAEVLPTVIAALTNDDRQKDNVPGLKMNAILQKAAQMKADDMAQKGYFAHNSPEGATPWHWIDKAGYRYDYAGENLAVNFFDSADVNKAWMDSVLHRENIMNERFTEIGIATAKGVYEGQETVFIVQMFGRPISVEAEARPQRAVAVARTKSSAKATTTVDTKPDQLAVQGQEGAGEGEVGGATAGSDEPIAVVPAVVLPKASAFKKVVAMPRLMNAYLYGVLLTIVALALALKIFIKIRIQHTQLIANGVMLLILMASALAINQKIALAYAHIL